MAGAHLVSLPMFDRCELRHSQPANPVEAMKTRARTAVADAGGIRERILGAAMSILYEGGIQALSQIQVARRADVRQSHLTYYFPTRRDLLLAVAERFADGVARGILDTGTLASNDRGDAIHRMAVAICDERHMRMFTGVIAEADSDPELRAMLVDVTRRMQSTLAALLGGEDAEQRAQVVLASIWGIGLYNFLLRSRRGAISPTTLLASLNVDAAAQSQRRRGRRGATQT